MHREPLHTLRVKTPIPARPLAIAALAVTLCAAGVTVTRAAAGGLAESVSREATRLLAAPHAEGEDAGARNEAERLLREAQRDADAGRTFLALEDLARGRGLLLAMAAGAQHPAAARDLGSFESLWTETAPRLEAAQRSAVAHTWRDEPAAVRALTESALGKTLPLLEASRAYARVTSPGAGVFYLGQAQAGLDLATFCFDLPTPRSGDAAPRRSLLPEITALQSQTDALFQPPRSIDRHPDFIRLNATLKLAGELDAARLYGGAAYQLLDATQQLAVLEAPAAAAGAAAASDAAGDKLAGWRKRLTGERRDTSLGQLFLERAESWLSGPHGTGPDIGSAVADRVLPAYMALLDAAGSIPQKAENAASVTVTLVRWPYT